MLNFRPNWASLKQIDNYLTRVGPDILSTKDNRDLLLQTAIWTMWATRLKGGRRKAVVGITVKFTSSRGFDLYAVSVVAVVSNEGYARKED